MWQAGLREDVEGCDDGGCIDGWVALGVLAANSDLDYRAYCGALMYLGSTT